MEGKLNVIIIGATGAVGRELVDLLLKLDNYSKITIPVRRKIDRWEKLTPEQSAKLNIIMVKDLDFLGEGKEDIEKIIGTGTEYHAVFCCLGSRVGRGDEEFKKVDYTYVVQSCELCEKFSIPHFTLVSSTGVSKDSWMLYLRTKGLAEEEVLKHNIEYISILQPGMLLNRDNDSRTMETIGAFIPFFPKIETKALAMAMTLDDLNYQKNQTKERKAIKFSNAELLKLAEDFKNSSLLKK